MRNVAGVLALKFLPAEQARLANARAVDPEAHDAYLKGLQHWYKLTPADFDAAEGYFELALQKDPNYALPYVGLSLVWAGRNQTGLMRPSEAAPKVMVAALKAVELDNTLAEAHFMLAVAKTWHVWDLPGAGPEWERAIELNPNFPDARAFCSHFLMIMRRPDEAMAQIKRALELDPFNSPFQGIYAQDLLFLRRYDDAIAQVRSTLRSTPNDPLTTSTLWSAYRLKGMKREALAAAKAYCGYYSDPAVDESFDRGYAEAGYAGAMKAAAKAMEARFRTVYVSPLDIATLYLEAGDKGQALAWLEKGYAERDPNMPYLIQPDFDALRSEPRFQELLRRMGIPQN